MSFFSVCKEDPMLMAIRKNFDAIPLKNPEFRNQPLTTFSWNMKTGETKFMGKLTGLFENEKDFKTTIYKSALSQIKIRKTRKVNTSFGIDLLNGFAAAIGMDLTPISGAFDEVKQVSFSFENINRFYIDKNEVGGILGNCTLNQSNLNLRDFKTGESPYRLMLIDSVITASRFNMHTEKTKSFDFRIEPDIFGNVATNAKMNWEVSIQNQKDLRFEGIKPIPFAVTVITLDIDWEKGSISGFREMSKDVKSLGEKDTTAQDGELLVWDS